MTQAPHRPSEPAAPYETERPRRGGPTGRRRAPAGLLVASVSGYLPAAVTVAGVLLMLRVYGTPLPVSAAYLVYLALAVTLPGTLLWRRVRGPRVSLVEDLAIGAAVGLAAQVVLAYALAPLRLSGLSWVWAPVVVVLALTPGWRSVWSRSRAPRSSLVGAWAQAVAALGATAWISATAIANNPLTYLDGAGPWSRAVPASAYVDLPFHHAIAAGIDSTYPLVYPYLLDEPLRYHLFVYEHLAGASHVTGIDLTWLVYRLDPVSLVVLGVVLAGVLARRLAGVEAAGPVASVLVTLSGAVPVYGWIAYPFQNPGFLHFAVYRSPTQTFGLPIFLAALTAAAVLVRRRTMRGNLRLVAVFTLLAVAAGGAKSTFLPVLVCGLLLALVAAAVLRAGAWRPVALLTGLAAGAFGVLTVVLLGGQTGSATVAPLSLLRSFAVTPALGGAPSTGQELFVLVLALAAWLCAGAGGVLLLSRRGVTDPALWLVTGTLVAGICGALLTAANGLSQLYFLYASWPLLGVLSAWGLARACSGAGRRLALTAGVAVLLGAAVVPVIAGATGRVAPAALPGDLPLRAALTPWAVLAATSVVVGVVAALAHRRSARSDAPGRPGSRHVALVAMVALLVGAGMSQRGGEVLDAVPVVVEGRPGVPEGWPLPREGAVAALEVRDRSQPEDVVATNAHCYGPPEACDSRHFWVSALTERRVLVEGWAYPEGFRPGQTRTSPFWDQERYAENEAVFTDPTQEAVDLLAEKYGVRWLFVDRSVYEESEELRSFADLVHETDGFAVYELG